ncbi:phosphatidylinositol mannoside acyltransferase [Corynebacterium auriscanis]|uniref:phosphatidylinositol mannoside acyltransferase n=1 Tax=Corynebacterium auriscanis TaxID=99807 RepID=UPI003CF17569
MSSNTAQELRESLTAFAYKAGWKLTAIAPEPVARWIFTAMADVASKKGKGPEQLRRNLARVVGPENVTKQLVRDAMRSYMRYWREAFRLPTMVGESLVARIDAGFTQGSAERVFAAIARGRGVVVTLPHSANWDMAGVWLVAKNGEFTTVAERLKPESLFDAFVDYRESLGFKVIALTGAERPPMELMEEVLREGGVVCLMGERDLTGRGVLTRFFGEAATLPPGPALLAQRTGAVLMTAGMSFTEHRTRGRWGLPRVEEGWRIHVGEPIDTDRPLEDIVQQQADEFAANIARDPADWHILQPVWLADLSMRRLRAMGMEQRVNRPACDGLVEQEG